MQSVGEAMAIGRTFAESLQKGFRSLETGRLGLNADPAEATYDSIDVDELVARSAIPTPERPFQLEAALRRGVSVERLAETTGIDRWFLDQIARITEERARLEAIGVTDGFAGMDRRSWRRAKRMGFSDGQLAHLFGVAEADVRSARLAEGVAVTFKTVDTCGAEFEASTPYHYGTYEDEDEVRPAERPRVVILGSGPNRIGQGIEFDYCCVHASFVLRDAGYETVMVNCNPETVSTDYDTSDRLYFEPLTHEDVLNVIEVEKPVGVIVALGGQTPLKLAAVLPARARDGHERRVDRSRGRPRAVECAVRAARDPPTGRRHGDRGRGGARCRRAGGLPRARAPVVRPRWTRDADRLRRRRARFRDG